MIAKIFALILLTASLSFATTKEDQDCKEAYRRLYQKDEVRMSLFLGYLDGDGQADDPMTLTSFTTAATKPCSDGKTFCGFSRDRDDAEIFTKTISGPDGKPKKIRLQMMASAYSPYDSLNRGLRAKAQDKKSDEIAEKFQKALTTDEVVIYNGHSRYGTGPGFKPLSKADWLNALKDKPGLNEMTKTLRTSKSKPQVLGMIACESEDYYGRNLHEASPNSALLLTRQTTVSADANMIVYNSLSSLLGMKCQKDFRRSLSDATQYLYLLPGDNGTYHGEKMPEMVGFFEPITKKFEEPSLVSTNALEGVIGLGTIYPRKAIESAKPKAAAH